MTAPGSCIFHGTVLRDPAEAVAIWRVLLGGSPASIYQSPDLLLPWLDAYGRPKGIEPLFLAVSDDAGPLLLLPLGLRRFGPLRIAECLGGKHANFNLPIFDPGRIGADASAISAALRQAARLAQLDLLVLANQPERWQDIENPLIALKSLPSPSFGHALKLDPDGDALMARLVSKDRRKKLRQKRNGIMALGPMVFEEANDAESRHAMLDTYFAQKARRFDGQGVADPFADPGIRRWLWELAGSNDDGETAPLRLFGLKLNETYAAIWGVGQHRDAISGMITSFASDPALARYSPGELLLERIIRIFCAEGRTLFDFGVGEAHYKTLWSTRTIPLFDSHLGMTTKGVMLAGALRCKTRLKRFVKQSPRLMGAIARLRKLRRG